MDRYGHTTDGSKYGMLGSSKFSQGSHGYDTGNPLTQRQGYAGGQSGETGRYGTDTDFRAPSSRGSAHQTPDSARDKLRSFHSQQYYERDGGSQMTAQSNLRDGPDEYGIKTNSATTPPRRPPDNVRSQRQDAVPPSPRSVRRQAEAKKAEKADVSRRRMDQSYAEIMERFSKQQAKLVSRPTWKNVRTQDAEAPDDLIVTHVNQTSQLNKFDESPGLLDAKFSESMSSVEWLKAHSIAAKNLTLKHLVDKGQIGKPDINPATQKVRQHVQFEAHDINEFEYKLNMAIELYTQRIKWLLQGSRRFFGMVKGSKVGVMIDCSDSNCGFGRLNSFQEALTHLLDEQLSKKKGLFLQCFGTQPLQLWNSTMDVSCRSVDEAKQWLDAIKPSGGTNLLRALKVMFQHKDIDTILLILGSTPDQRLDVLTDYVAQLGAGRSIPIQTVAYDCSDKVATGILQELADNSGGRYHCYASATEDQLYSGTDVADLVTEIQTAQDVCNKVKDMRQGLLGTALVSVLNEIKSEVAKLPQSRFLPRPPGHEDPLRVEMASFQPTSSSDWLTKHGLKANGLDLYQVLAPNAYSFKEEFIPVIRKTVHSQVHGSAMTQFEWHDGTMKNVHVDMTQLFEYQKQLGSTVKLYEKRIDWLGSASRKIFGTVTENRVVILVDLSVSNLNYLVHIQHSLRLLLEQQMANKDYFNIVTFGSEAKPFRPTMIKPTAENLQAAWAYVLDMQCGGSRNFMAALHLAVENDEEAKHNIEVEGVYLFTSGIPDQQADVSCNYVEEAAAGRNLKVHVALFNVDDYDAHGAIPSRYANITKTAECLRNLAHCSAGRFHWFRETGIIESDDIAAVNLEIEKSLNFSKKCSMLVGSVKKKYNINEGELKQLSAPATYPALPSTEPLKALLPPRHTVLSQTRIEAAEVTEASKTLFRPSSASSSRGDASTRGRPASAMDPMARVKRNRVQKSFFFTDDKSASNQVGSVFRKYPTHKPKAKPIKAHSIPDQEEQLTTKEWLRKYSLQRLKLNLNKIVSGPETRHTANPVRTINKAVESKVFQAFPTVNINGQLAYLQLQPRELREYSHQVEHVLHRYLRRLQWLLAGSRRVFSTVVESKCVFLIDTSGSMDTYMEELKKELASLIWDQLHKHRVKFNLIQFSRNCEQWEGTLVDPTEENCHRAVKWVSQLSANGNTCTLEALEMAFAHLDLDAVYLLTDGKPDTSTSLVLKEVQALNNNRGIVVNTISFNCEDVTANNFLKTLGSQTGGRYHRCHSDFDAPKFAHKLLSEGFNDHEYPPLPDFEGDDLKKLGSEITAARRFLSQAHQYGTIQENHQKQRSGEEERVRPVRPKSGRV